MRGFLLCAEKSSVFPHPRVLAIGRFFLRHLPKDLWVGYLDPSTGLPWSGQWLAFTLFLASAALYFAINLYKWTHLGDATYVPALAYALLLVRDRNELALLKERWALKQKTGEQQPTIQFACFQFNGTDAPLSWIQSSPHSPTSSTP